MAGAAYPVTIDPIIANGTPQNANKVLQVDQSYMWLGFSVASAGDVNGDGYSDVIVGAPQYDLGQNNEGAAFVYPGTAAGLSLAAVTLECNQADAKMGYSVASAGDFNGDGYADVLISDFSYFISYDAQKNILIEGAVLVFYGSQQGLDLNTKTLIPNTQSNSSFGWSVSSAGDVNGDGYDDILIGDPNYDIQFDEGAAFVYLGSSQGINLNSKITLTGSWASEQFGNAVSNAGDVNGDGFDDIIVGVPNYSSTQAGEGCIVVYYGSNAGITAANNKRIASGKVNAGLGSSVAGIGDVNGDGFADVLTGAYNYSNGQDYEGAAMVFYGSNAGLSSVPTLMESNISYAQLGNTVASAGDLDGDGYGEVIFGGSYSGSLFKTAFINNGSANGISPLSAMSSPVTGLNLTDQDYLKCIAGGGDINGDGRNDLIGEVASMNGGTGKIFAFLSNSNGCTRNNLRLYNTDLSTPINHTQFPQPNFGAGLFAKSFTGRNKGKLTWETKPANQGFSKGSNNRITNSTQSTGSQNDYTSLGTVGTELKNLIDKQGLGTKVRVRVKYDPVLAITGQT